MVRRVTFWGAIAGCLAVVGYAWFRIIVPNVSGVSISHDEVTIRMTPEYAQRMAEQVPQLHGTSGNGFPLLHDGYVIIPIPWLLICLVLALVVSGAAGWWYWRASSLRRGTSA